VKIKNATAAQLSDFIAKLCNEEEYESVEGRWTFKSGGDCGCCTDGATKVAVAFEGRVVGYKSLPSTSAVIGYQQCGGHDFAIVANRFVVDYWAFRVARLITTPVFDIENPDERKIVESLYGNEQTWEDVSVAGEDRLPR
jgi:hypothetical protein